MARSRLFAPVKDRAGNQIVNARVNVFLAGTSTPVSDLYTAASGGSAVAFLTSGATGHIDGWFDTPKAVRLVVTDNTNTAYYVGAAATLLDFADYEYDNVPVYENPGDGETDDTTLATATTNIATLTTGLADLKLANTYALRPAAGTFGRFYMASWAGTTITRLYRDNGTSWVAVGDAPGVFNPLDYGADPTAAVDSRAAVLACINAAATPISSGLPYANGIVYGEIQWTAGQYKIDGGSITLPSAIPLKQTAVGGTTGTFAWQQQVIIRFTTGGFILDASQSNFATWDGLYVISANGQAMFLDRGAGWGIFRNCTIRSTTAGQPAMTCRNTFWGYADNTSFEAPDTATPSVLIESSDAYVPGREGWLYQFINCRFNLAGVRWDVNGNGAGTNLGIACAMHFCVGENFGANTALLHIRNTHATTGTSLRGWSMNSCYVDDSPATVDLIKLETLGTGQLLIDEIDVVASGHGNSGFEIRCVETGGGQVYVDRYSSTDASIDFGTANGSTANKVISVGDRARSALFSAKIDGDAQDRVLIWADGKISRGDGTAFNEYLTIFHHGTGTPEGVVTAGIGSIFQRRDGGAGTSMYVKESGVGTNTGWVAK